MCGVRFFSSQTHRGDDKQTKHGKLNMLITTAHKKKRKRKMCTHLFENIFPPFSYRTQFFFCIFFTNIGFDYSLYKYACTFFSFFSNRPPAERSGKGCCVSWFAGPPLRALIVVVALGGLACTLGGAAIGITGLSGSTTSHLTAALLMIGII